LNSKLLLTGLTLALAIALYAWLRPGDDRPSRSAGTPRVLPSARAKPPRPPTDPARRQAEFEHDIAELEARLAPAARARVGDGGTLLPPLPARTDDSPEAQAASDRITHHEMRLNILDRTIRTGRVKERIGRDFTEAQQATVAIELERWQDTFLASMVEWRQGTVTPTEFADRIDAISQSVVLVLKKELDITDEEWDALVTTPPPPLETRPQPGQPGGPAVEPGTGR
jgi:hypothetical protein